MAQPCFLCGDDTDTVPMALPDANGTVATFYLCRNSRVCIDRILDTAINRILTTTDPDGVG